MSPSFISICQTQTTGQEIYSQSPNKVIVPFPFNVILWSWREKKRLGDQARPLVVLTAVSFTVMVSQVTHLKVCACACLDVLWRQPLPHLDQSQALGLINVKHSLPGWGKEGEERREGGREMGWEDGRKRERGWRGGRMTEWCRGREGWREEERGGEWVRERGWGWWWADEWERDGERGERMDKEKVGG